VEIDEFQNYEKALGALGEAYKVLSQAKLSDGSQEMKMNDIKNRMMIVKKFTEAKASVFITRKTDSKIFIFIFLYFLIISNSICNFVGLCVYGL